MENWNNFPSSSNAPHPSLIIQHPNQNLMPAMPTNMPQFDQSSFSSHYPTNNVVYGQSSTTVLPLQNQPMRIENGFRLDNQPKTEAETLYENYLKQYCWDSSWSCEAKFDDLLNSDSALMESDSDLMESDCLDFHEIENSGHSDPNNGTTQFCTSTYNNFSATSPAQMERTGYLSDVVNSCGNNRMHLTSLPPEHGAVAATNGGANSSEIKKKHWTLREHMLLLIGIMLYGRGDWKTIAENVVLTKTHTQVASHAQKYFLRQSLPKGKQKRMSIHDISTFNPELLMEVLARLNEAPPPQPPLMNYSLPRMLPDQIQQPQPLQKLVPTDQERLG